MIVEMWLLIPALLAAMLLVYMNLEARFGLEIVFRPIKVKKVRKKIRVVQFSDVHLSLNYSLRPLRKIVSHINRLRPDLVVFTGDLYDQAGLMHDEETVAKLLASISAPVKVCVFGNHDFPQTKPKRFVSVMEQAGFQVLQDESFITEIKGLQMEVQGLKYEGEILHKAYETGKESDFRLVAAHVPEALLQSEVPFDLGLCGHNHGGQINIFWIPWFRHLKLGHHDFSRLAGFFKSRSGSDVYISKGLGTSRIQARLFAHPEICVFDLIP